MMLLPPDYGHHGLSASLKPNTHYKSKRHRSHTSYQGGSDHASFMKQRSDRWPTNSKVLSDNRYHDESRSIRP